MNRICDEIDKPNYLFVLMQAFTYNGVFLLTDKEQVSLDFQYILVEELDAIQLIY